MVLVIVGDYISHFRSILPLLMTEKITLLFSSTLEMSKRSDHVQSTRTTKRDFYNIRNLFIPIYLSSARRGFQMIFFKKYNYLRQPDDIVKGSL